MMRKHALIAFYAVLTFVTTASVKAQETTEETKPDLYTGEIGFRLMPTFSSLRLNTYNGETVQGAFTLSLGYGAMLGINLNKNLGLQAEVNYLEIMQKYKDHGLEREVHLNYINIPLLVSFSLDKTKPVNFNVVIGPQLGLNIGSSLRTYGSGETDSLQAVVAVKEGDTGLAYGAGLEFALNPDRNLRLDVGFRGVYGLVDIRGKETAPNTYNVIVKGARKSYGGYLGLTYLF
ncbi:MAG: porin family protein [Bacteroidota bacterium]